LKANFRNSAGIIFQGGITKGGKDTLGTSNPSGMSKIMRSIARDCEITPLNALSLSVLCYKYNIIRKSKKTIKIKFSKIYRTSKQMITNA